MYSSAPDFHEILRISRGKQNAREAQTHAQSFTVRRAKEAVRGWRCWRVAAAVGTLTGAIASL
jgi:hypothetical protein